MVVQSSNSAPCSPSSDPLRGVQHSLIGKATKETEIEFSHLKSLVPTISKKQSVSKLDVILEAIRYIDQLQDQLMEQMGASERHQHLLVGKENKDTELIRGLEEVRRNRQRHRSQ